MSRVITRKPQNLLMLRHVIITHSQRTFIKESFAKMMSKIKTVYFGADRPKPPPKPDWIWEEMLRVYPKHEIPYERRTYLREHVNQVYHRKLVYDKNRRYRDLEKKINGNGKFHQNDFLNKF